MEQKKINHILSILAIEIENLFKNNLKNIILYGSYARGDYNNESDIDVMVLVDMDDIKLKRYTDRIIDLEVELNLKYDVVLSIITKDYNEFEKWRPALPFYQNVINEGVIVDG